MNVPGGTPEGPVRTGKLAVLGAEVRKYDKALQRLQRKLQLANVFQSTPQRVDAIRYAMDAVCQRRNARTPNILREAREIVGDRNLARLRGILAPSLRNIAPGRPWKVEAQLCDGPAFALRGGSKSLEVCGVRRVAFLLSQQFRDRKHASEARGRAASARPQSAQALKLAATRRDAALEKHAEAVLAAIARGSSGKEAHVRCVLCTRAVN